ncbi:MAG: tRNA uridine-5-carboxymethylaminomethyl(34) synthesis GTPase MnmE [Bacteroidota bacterium]|nr:tRNA uridine-5-carboxymethylaminomethyl(34) synthesis GTPase MnmE [Bacteroidota bacterium]MDP3145283.1 tRNA uridine-5-carboxymethylaminomethyl(34) synthesis GTPase MnmE [Bacteroidota bacterium]
METNDTIVALATSHGSAAIAVIRLSGPKAFNIVEESFYSKKLIKKTIHNKQSHTLHFGLIIQQDIIIDEVLVSIFKGPNSYTGQDSVEVSCHGSTFIQQQLLQLFLASGARHAEPGEFTLRAFLNGKFDLSQAEAVADLIASNSAISHQVAMQHMRGGFSDKIKLLRENLINFASLIELELDFSEEDVEFANRTDLKKLILSINTVVQKLVNSFELGNVIKNGIPVAIVGKPNAGKSTLLNVLLEDDRAIVSEIAGTTRDTIEDEITIDGVLFRFIDTAGIRTTTDVIEQIGVNKAYEAIQKSAIVIYLFDSHELSSGDLKMEIEMLKDYIGTSQLVIVANKIDTESLNDLKKEFSDFPEIIFISAKTHEYIKELKLKLLSLFDARIVSATDTIVTNARHANSLINVKKSLEKVLEGLDKNIVADLLALDIRYALDEIGTITGQVTNEDLLTNIFSKFCIGK